MVNKVNYLEPIREIFWQFGNRVEANRMTKIFQPKVRVYIEKPKFIVKTITSGKELEEVLRLRYNVFHREYRNKRFPFGLDTEIYDIIADHLVILDRSTDKIVGTYRLICSDFSKVFYSQSEFFMANFLKQPGIKLELSRACIHRDYRKGVVMNLLWRGLTEYIRQVNADYLFGCSSVKTMDATKVSALNQHFLEKGVVLHELGIQPLPNYQMPILGIYPVKDEAFSANDFVPPLLASYLKAGAKVAPMPALDRAFRCVDYFTVLKMADLTALYEKRYSDAGQD